jgi:hypothetical protein
MLRPNAWLQSSYLNPKLRKPRQNFSTAEDQALLQLVSCLGEFDWNAIAHQMPGRSARQCRDRWKGYLSPYLSNDAWTAAEDQVLMDQWSKLGPRWSMIASILKGRSEVSVKNRWKLLCRRKTAIPASSPEPPVGDVPMVFEPPKLPSVSNCPSMPMPVDFVTPTTTTAAQKELEAFFNSLHLRNPLTSSFSR